MQHLPDLPGRRKQSGYHPPDLAIGEGLALEHPPAVQRGLLAGCEPPDEEAGEKLAEDPHHVQRRGGQTGSAPPCWGRR